VKKISCILAVLILATGLVTTVYSYNEDMEKLQRALYHATELEKELSALNVKDRDVLVKKVRFIKERLKEEVTGNPSEIKTYKKIN